MKIKIHNRYKNKIINLHIKDFSDNNSKLLEKINWNLPININYKLTSIKGINLNTSNYLLIYQGFSKKSKLFYILKYKNLFINKLNFLINEKKFILNNLVKKYRLLNIIKLKKNGSYKGLRHYLNLPVRGQRTCSNAKTRKKYKII